MHFQKPLKYLMCLEFTCRAKTNFQRTLHLNVEKNLNKFPWAILYSHFSFPVNANSFFMITLINNPKVGHFWPFLIGMFEGS